MASLSGGNSLSLFDRKRKLASKSGNHFYGDGGTVHGSLKLDVEIDAETGEVTAVWYRCLNLPFQMFSRENPCHINPDTEIHGIETSR
jgi:hypothetical protein